MSNLDMAHRQFPNIPEDKFRINELWSIKCYKHKTTINKIRLQNTLKYFLDQVKQSIRENNYDHPIGILATDFHKPVGEENLYVQVGYGLHTMCNIPKYKFCDQWTLIRLTRTNRSTINDTKMKTKSPKNTTSKTIYIDETNP